MIIHGYNTLDNLRYISSGFSQKGRDILDKLLLFHCQVPEVPTVPLETTVVLLLNNLDKLRKTGTTKVSSKSYTRGDYIKYNYFC